MANKTTNYGLTKPLANEFYDINVQNENMDVIDAKLKELSDFKPDVSGEINEHNTSSNSHSDIRTAVSEAKQSASQALIDAKSYTDAKILAIPTPDVSGQISTHNTSSSAHNDIRTAVSNVQKAADNAQTTADEVVQACANLSVSISTVNSTAKLAKSTAESASMTANSANTAAQNAQSTADSKAPMYGYGTSDLTAGSSSLETGKLYFVYE